MQVLKALKVIQVRLDHKELQVIQGLKEPLVL
jgi:hypothetical protein